MKEIAQRLHLCSPGYLRFRPAYGEVLAGVLPHGIIATADSEFFGDPSISLSLYTRYTKVLRG